MQFLFRFDRPRQHQERMMDDIYSALSAKRSILINAPTGIGKTDASLSAALTLANEKGLDVMFLTHKISQHRIVLDALQGTNAKFGLNMPFIDLVGKRNMCINTEVNLLEGEAFYMSCDKKMKAGSCPFYNSFKESCKDSVPSALSSAALQGHGALLDASFRHGVCAYEVSTQLARKARVIVADYAHLLNPYTKASFMKKIAHNLSNTIIIWDEAHNILESAANYMESYLSNFSIDNAQKELASIGNDMDLDYLQFALKKITKAKLADRLEAFVDPQDIPEEITNNIEEIAEKLQKAGLEYSEKSKAKRSSLMHLSKFLYSWKASMQESSVAKIIKRSGPTVRLNLTCLYPSVPLQVLKESYANVFMSATLAPPKMYFELLGVGDADVKSYESPFPQSNRLAVIDEAVTTKYESRSVFEYGKIASRICAIKDSTPGNIAVFFPSFELLDNVHRQMGRLGIHAQKKEMKSPAVRALIDRFSSSTDAILFGVMGGSLSEGIDYANNVIKAVVVVGIPLTRPDLELRAKMEHYERMFPGKGAEYSYITPAVIRAIQAAGRAIRSERDRAAIVFMDRRYAWSMYSSLIRNSMPLLQGDDIPSMIRKFWAPGAAHPPEAKVATA